jgi:hypothetical protein
VEFFAVLVEEIVRSKRVRALFARELVGLSMVGQLGWYIEGRFANLAGDLMFLYISL